MNEKILKEIKRMIDHVRHGYHFRNYVTKLCDVEFASQPYPNKDFKQFPIRIIMEFSDFNGQVDNSPLGRDLGEDISKVEFNYIIGEIKKHDKNDLVDGAGKEVIFSMLSNLPSDFNPKFILIPVDLEFYLKFHHLVDEGIAKYEQSKLFLNYSHFKIEVIWSSRDRPLDEIILLGEHSLKWTYKYNHDMFKLKGEGTEFNEYFNKEKDLLNALYKVENNKIDLVFRTVGVIEINPQKIRRFPIKDFESRKDK